MTVDELLDRIIALPGASPEAMKTYAPVFRARFGKREGPHLRAALEETLATFKSTFSRPFPIPAEIEAHMPSLKRPDEEGGKPIRQFLEARDTRSRKLLTEWMEGQGRKIRDTRAGPLYSACLLTAMDRAKLADERTQRLVLSADDLKACFQKALSTDRLRRHGPPPKDARRWWAQLDEIAREWSFEITPEWWSEEACKTLNRKEAA